MNHFFQLENLETKTPKVTAQQIKAVVNLLRKAEDIYQD